MRRTRRIVKKRFPKGFKKFEYFTRMEDLQIESDWYDVIVRMENDPLISRGDPGQVVIEINNDSAVFQKSIDVTDSVEAVSVSLSFEKYVNHTLTPLQPWSEANLLKEGFVKTDR